MDGPNHVAGKEPAASSFNEKSQQGQHFFEGRGEESPKSVGNAEEPAEALPEDEDRPQTEAERKQEEEAFFKRQAINAIDRATEEIVAAVTRQLMEAKEFLLADNTHTKSAVNALLALSQMPTPPEEAAEHVKGAERAVRDVVVLRCHHVAKACDREAFIEQAELAFEGSLSRELSAQLLLAYRKVAEKANWKDTETFPSNNKKAAERRGHVRPRRRHKARADTVFGVMDPEWQVNVQGAATEEMQFPQPSPNSVYPRLPRTELPEPQKVQPSDNLSQPVPSVIDQFDECWTPWQGMDANDQDGPTDGGASSSSAHPALPVGLEYMLQQMSDNEYSDTPQEPQPWPWDPSWN